MKHLLKRAAAVLLSLVITSQIAAKQISLDSMYEGNVPVNSMSDADRDSSIQQALAQVLVKVSGNSNILISKAIKDDIANASSYVVQFNYYQRQDTNANPPIQTIGMTVYFDPNFIKRVLAKVNQKVWATNRPVTLLWLAVPTDQGRALIGAEDEGGIPAYVERDAGQRGISLLLPMLDLEDINSMSVDNVWNPNVQNIIKASNRYAADVILIGHLENVSDKIWKGSWTALAGTNSVRWNTQANTKQEALAMAVNNLADGLAARSAKTVEPVADAAATTTTPLANTITTLSFTVTGINNLNDFNQVKKYLASLAPVKKLDASSVQANYVVFQGQVQGGLAALNQSINADKHLRIIASAKTSKVVYQWSA